MENPDLVRYIVFKARESRGEGVFFTLRCFLLCFLTFQSELVTYKSSHKIQFWFPWRYFGRQYGLIVIFRLSVGLKFSNFHFSPMKSKFSRGRGEGGGVFLSVKFLLKTIDVKNDDF